jgi:fluoroacetyl-CoA thioesterase
MAEPLDNVRAGMTGRHEVVVTRELTVGAHLDGMPFVFGTPMMILAMEMASAAAVAAHLPAGWVDRGERSQCAPSRADSGRTYGRRHRTGH